MEHIENELRAVEKLCKPGTHKNIVAVVRYGRFPPSYYFIDMELCDINLECWIERRWSTVHEKTLPYMTADFPPRMRMSQIWDIMEDVLNGVAFIHSRQEIHRDLKPRNSKSQVITTTDTSSIFSSRSRLEDRRFWAHV